MVHLTLEFIQVHHLERAQVQNHLGDHCHPLPHTHHCCNTVANGSDHDLIIQTSLDSNSYVVSDLVSSITSSLAN